ncbi:hypothetical protein [Spirillospora sp. NPDC047279]|uniref:hypothetical protein n=1 Tax=Spirillospora sp. NPDC047279 TaxID=3155478 RepID=UPI0033D69CB1
MLTSDSAPTGGAAIFDADHATGEYFYACDLDADGHWAYANFSWGGQSLTIRDYGEENGTCTESTAVDFPEGQSVLVTACLINKITRSLDYCRTALTNA